MTCPALWWLDVNNNLLSSSSGYFHSNVLTISYPDMRVQHCPFSHSVATLINPGGVTTVSHKHILTVARLVNCVVAVPSTVHYPANCKIKIYYLI
jgi:hypothetical protein